MDTRTQRRLRLDRRLTDRRGWISPEELERELSALPDVAEKAAAVQSEEAEAATASAPGAAADPPPSSVPE